ncbi:MAG: SCP2 sterol-binding domain-containing protein [Actinomycetota bacterium]|nr:SCP2 sterol-binding domain-containing protein [Actinomycetota bacterium]
MSAFADSAEFREVMDRTFAMMSDDPDMGPKLREADTPQRFEFTDVDLVVNVRAARDGENGNLHWEWTDDVDWEPRVKMAMSTETCNRYFQGKENVAMAIARRRIKTGGDVKAALSLIPITKPIYERYREMVTNEYPHLRA